MAEQISERRLVDVLVESFRKTHKVRREVSHYEKSIDVVTYSAETELLDAIEAKCKDWRRAIQQAILNLTAVDHSYVALWSRTAHRIDRALLLEYGIGLISVGTKWGDVQVLLAPRKSGLTNRFIRKQLGDEFGRE